MTKSEWMKIIAGFSNSLSLISSGCAKIGQFLQDFQDYHVAWNNMKMLETSGRGHEDWGTRFQPQFSI